MVIIVLTACPAGLRGHLTRWLLEISAGVFGLL
jgi:CRISPR-associated protein Cas2